MCIFLRSSWKMLHLTEFFYTGATRGARDKYQVWAIPVKCDIILLAFILDQRTENLPCVESSQSKVTGRRCRFPCCISFIFVTLIFVMKYKFKIRKMRVSWVGPSAGLNPNSISITSSNWPTTLAWRQHQWLLSYCFIHFSFWPQTIIWQFLAYLGNLRPCVFSCAYWVIMLS